MPPWPMVVALTRPTLGRIAAKPAPRGQAIEPARRGQAIASAL